MDLLSILVILGIVISSLKSSQNAKNKSKSRQTPDQGHAQSAKAKSSQHTPASTAQAESGLDDVVGQVFGQLKGLLSLDDEEDVPTTQPKKKKKSTQQKNTSQPKQQPAAASAHQPRERRDAHERLKPTVKPVKSVFVEADDCGQRIELNPNIPYGQAQPKRASTRPTVTVRYDEETILQSIIWAEILSKPKGLENWARYAPKEN